MKYLRVTMPNGERWAVPVSIIAHHRATYYADYDAEKDNLSQEERDQVYEDEYYVTIKDDLEIYDWAPNNMNWSDVKEQAVFLGPKELTEREYQEGWINGEKKIVGLDPQSLHRKVRR